MLGTGITMSTVRLRELDHHACLPESLEYIWMPLPDTILTSTHLTRSPPGIHTARR